MWTKEALEAMQERAITTRDTLRVLQASEGNKKKRLYKDAIKKATQLVTALGALAENYRG